MATFAQIQARVQTWLRDLPASTQADIPNLINEAQRELQRRHNFRVMQASTVLTTSADSNALGSIADFKEPRQDPYWTDADGATTPLSWEPSLDFLIQRYQDTDDGAPRLVFWSGTDGTGAVTLQVYPKSDSLSQHGGGQYPVTIPYWKFVPDLVADGDTNWFTVRADKYLRLHAIGWGHMLNLEEGRGGAYLQTAEIEAQGLIMADKSTWVKRPQVMRYSVDAGNRAARNMSWWR